MASEPNKMDPSRIITSREPNISLALSSTVIVVDKKSNSSLNKPSLVYDSCNVDHVPDENQPAAKQISLSCLQHRVYMRHFYITRLTLVSNMMSFLAVLGIILMVIENELTFDCIDNQDTKASWFIKWIISLSTVVLLTLIFYYHYVDMIAYAHRNSLEDWRVELTITKILLITLELIICAIHPRPGSYPNVEPKKLSANISLSLQPYSMYYIATDVGLGLPMFFRLYLLCRSFMHHSYLTRNITLRSFGYLNNVTLDVYFLIKAYLKQWPTRCLLIFTTLIFFIGSWCLRACDYKSTGDHLSMSDSMWLFVITFTTVGYGDLYPSTYCGRSVAAVIVLIGLLLSAISIAILSSKLLLTQEQKYVHTYVLNTGLHKQLQNQAANVIKFSIKIWFLRKHNKSSSIVYFLLQRKLFRSIHSLQDIRQEQRNLDDTCVGFTELNYTQNQMNINTQETIGQILTIKSEVKEIRQELKNFNHSIDNLQKTLMIVLNKTTKE